MKKCKYGQYDETSRQSILTHALLLLNKSLLDLYEEEIQILPEEYLNLKAKGRIGTLVEKLHFEYEPNNKSEPDFPLAKLELKTTPLKIAKNRYVSKERLVLSMIEYKRIVNESFETSAFLRKNSSLLLLFYLYEQDKLTEQLFKLIKLWEIPKEDYHVIKEDWIKICTKVKEGRAEEISGGDTFYLEAARKGAGKGRDLTEQPFSEVNANRRAFAFKSRYVNQIIQKDGSLENILDKDFLTSKTTIEEYILKKFKPYIGKTVSELEHIFNLTYSVKKKDKAHVISKAILGVAQDKRIGEFEKANIQIKTVNLNKNDLVKESMSFQKIDYHKILNEEWEDSDFYINAIDKKFFFVIFKEQLNGAPILFKVMFWNMPVEMREQAKVFWEDTKNKIQLKDTSNFWKISDNKIFHVRPKARNASDVTTLRDGSDAPKLAYWINAKVIEKIIIGN